MNYQTLRFEAMNCPCEILLDTEDATIGAVQLLAARQEADRIEQKYSRFLMGNLVDRLNHANGQPMEVDDETAALLDYAARCYEVSEGLFDITRQPMGWAQVFWQRPWFKLPEGFEIDFGGICKEYAADRILAKLRERHTVATLVNMGGDIAAAGDRVWSVGIEDPSQPGGVVRTISLRQGAVATSGTTKRLGHILDPRTTEPVPDAPLSVTVTAPTCTEAGFWSTLGILRGKGAEACLAEQALEFLCLRPS